jgi:ubiquitin-conjugating enzyme E2 S
VQANLSLDDLTQLDILIAGPTHTPFEKGVFKLHLTMPPNYPQHPPTANFRTSIFHPNVDPSTGGVCVETLKRDWDSNLTLRDVLITISCLLIQPNPDSALNAEAGALIQEGYEAFARRAELMTGIHAKIGPSLVDAVKEAQNRGQNSPEDQRESDSEQVAPRRRRTIARVRATQASQRSRRTGLSPTGAIQRRPVHTTHRPVAHHASNAFVLQNGNDDVFNRSTTPIQHATARFESPEDPLLEDSDMMEADQENDMARSPSKPPPTPKVTRTPRRPNGAARPLGELIMSEPDGPVTSPDTSPESSDDGDDDDDDDDDDMEPEYPPSPSKSPSKSPKRRPPPPLFGSPESSRDAVLRSPPFNITPPNLSHQPLAADSPFAIPSLSPRRARRGRGIFEVKSHLTPAPPDSSFLENSFFRPGPTAPAPRQQQQQQQGHGPTTLQTPSHFFSSPSSLAVSSSFSVPSARERRDAARRADLDAKMWELCGGDIARWNRGDFDGDLFRRKAARW